jgi:hypothetical protein
MDQPGFIGGSAGSRLAHPGGMLFAAAPFLIAAIVSGAGDVPQQQPSSSGDGRVALMRALERLMTTGEPRDVAHDDGELLQEAVTELIRRGDAEVERLAARAAAPIVVRVLRPVASIQSLPTLDVAASNVLTLDRPVPYTARIEGALDGGNFIPIAEVSSGGHGGARIDTVFPRLGTAPGFHRIRLRARIAFAPRDGRQKAWTERRDLPSVSYALYDETTTTQTDARAFLFSQLGMTAQFFDPQLPAIPLGLWLEQTLRPRAGSDGPSIMWLMQFCDERTSEAGAAPRTGLLCAVGYFGPRGVIAQVWFRTGRIDATREGFTWMREEPRFEGISMRESGADVGPLSSLPNLLDTSSETRPRGDVTIAPEDIVITPTGSTTASVTVTMRNAGDVALHRTLVDIAAAHSTTDSGLMRRFVVDIPARGSTNITLPVVFPAGYGVVAVTAMQATEHGTFADWVSVDPTPEDAAAFRIFNVQGAPPGYVHTIREACGCRGW